VGQLPDWSSSFESATSSDLGCYDDILVPRLFEPWANLLLDRVEPRGGQSALDVACGPGSLTRFVARRVGPTGRVTGCDLSPAMLGIARAKPPLDGGAPTEYIECAADALDLPDDSFDVVTCQQGLQFFPDRSAALLEMRRVARDGGRLGLAVWAAIEDCPPFAALATALGRVLGSGVEADYRAGPWGLADATAVEGLVHDGGFANVNVSTAELPIIFEGGAQQLLLTLRAAPVAATLRELPQSDLRRLEQEVELACQTMMRDGAVVAFTTSHIVVADT